MRAAFLLDGLTASRQKLAAMGRNRLGGQRCIAAIGLFIRHGDMGHPIGFRHLILP